MGYHFIETKTGAMNGNFLGIGADLAVNASVLVDAADVYGILITNGEFTAFQSPQWINSSSVESSHVQVNPSNKGNVKFVDSSFWGGASQVAVLNGTGSTTFLGCQFVEWDMQKKDGRAAIQAHAGSLIVHASEFSQDKKQVEIFEGVKKAAISGNIAAGAVQIIVHGNSSTTAIGLNV